MIDLSRGLVAHYPLDGTAKDASGHGYDGKAIGATPTKDRFGRDRHAYTFNGVDNEIVVDPPPILSDKAMSVSVWARFDLPEPASLWNDVTNNAKLRDPIAGQDDGYSLRSWQLSLCLFDGQDVALWHRLGEFSSAWSKTRVEAGKWYHIAAVWDGEEHHLYLNGVEEHSVKGIFKASRDEPLRIGAKGAANTKRAFFAGTIDELRIYDRALSADEIAALFHEPEGQGAQMNQIKREGNRVWIKGLENAEWGNATDRQNSVIAAAEAALRCAGEEVTYERLMGLGGAAFRIQHAWCPSSPHSMCGTNTIDPALAAVGYHVTWIDLKDKDGKRINEEQARQAIVRSIDGGLPVLYGSEECGLIVGYVDGAKKLLLRPYSPKKPGYSETEKWSWGIGVLERLPDPPPPQRASIIQSLQLSKRMMTTPKVGIYHSGFAAYDAWIRDLEADGMAAPSSATTRFTELDDKQLFAAMLGNGFTYGCLSNAREMADKYLQWAAPQLNPSAATHLTKAADLYAQMHQTMWKQRGDLPQPWSLMPWRLKPDQWTPQMRQAQAKVLRELLALEKQAMAELDQALAAADEG